MPRRKKVNKEERNIWKVGIYCRLSSDDGDNAESDSITNQKEIIEYFLKKEENIEIIEIESMEQFEQEVSNENGTIFIDFYATWCMPCKTMTPIIEELAKENKEVKFLKVDVDKNNELATKYNVMSIPTMLIIKNGKVTKTFVGVTDKESIMKEL